MAKINVDINYFNHPKTRRLKTFCGQESDIFPIRLWAFAAAYFPKDGVLRGYSGAEIEGILDFRGSPGDLIQALEKVQFLVKIDTNNYKIHDWQHHAGFLWKYIRSGQKGGAASAKYRREEALKRKGKTLEGKGEIRSTIELNGIELKKDVKTLGASAPNNEVPEATKLPKPVKERRASPPFQKPQLIELQTYCTERTNAVDAQHFLDYYDANGWRVGRNPMKDWKAAVRTWERSSRHQKKLEPKRELVR